MPRIRTAVASALVCVIGGLALAEAASAENIDLGEANEKVRKVRTKPLLNDAKLPYVKGRTSCRFRYKGHSHWAICTITFETKDDVNACQEKLEAYIQIRGSGTFDPFARPGVFTNHIWPLPRGAELCKPGSRILRTVPPVTG